MKRRLALLLSGLLFVLTGCSLAQPEAGDSAGDHFAGFFVVYDVTGSGRDAFYDNPNLSASGTKTLDTEYGKLSLLRDILVGERGKDWQYTFPGMEGLCLFLVHGENESGSPYSSVVSDLDRGDWGTNVNFTEGETVHTLDGTAYIGPPLDAGPDWDQYTGVGILTFYRVYEAADGTVYLDGSGNSSGGLGSYSENRTFSAMENGKPTAETIEVTVHMEYAPRLEKLTVTQFDENNALLRSDDLALREDLPEVACLPETAWALVEEQSGEGTVRTAYSASEVTEEEPEARHTVVLLDEDGLGTAEELCIRFSVGT